MRPEERLGDMLASRSWTVAVAESCTAGLLARTIVSVPGASAYFQGGIVAYSNTAKVEILGVPGETIQKNGAVSDRAALAMAIGAMSNFACDLGIAITGIAGPGGGSESKPVGTVFVAVACDEGQKARKLELEGDRPAIQEAATKAALELACDFLETLG
jgi:PncC family amidohydrolase